MRKLLIIPILALLLSAFAATGAKADTTTGLVGHWEFEDGSGTMAFDSAPFANNATLVYMQWDPGSNENNGLEACSDRDYCPTWTTGRFGGGLGSIGADITNVTGAGIQINNTNLYGLNDNFTIAMWFKTTQEQFESNNPSLYGMELMSNWIYGPFRGFDVSLWNTGIGSDSRISYRLDYDGSTACYGGGSIGPNNEIDGEWHNMVFLRDNQAIKVYVDGQLKFTNPCDGSAPESPVIPNGTSDMPLTIGWGSSSNYYAFNGSMDDVRIYDRPLTTEDVEELYGYGKVYGYWKFDEGTGDTAYDFFGNINLTDEANPTYPMGWSRGYENAGLEFDGNYDIRDYTPSVCLPTNGTISAWVNPKSCPNHLDGGCLIAGEASTSGYMDFGIWYSDYFHENNVSCAVGDVIGPTAYIPTDAWNMVTCKYNTTGVYLYVNGTVQAESGPQTACSYVENFQVGGWSPFWPREFNGTIDNVRFGEAFSDEQIAAYASEPYAPAPIVGNDIYACGGNITAPGTYTLQNDVDTSTGVIDDRCIYIESSDVDVNLNGHAVDCQSNYYTGVGTHYAYSGILTNITVHDGIVHDCTQTGIFGVQHSYNNVMIADGAFQFFDNQYWTSTNDVINGSSYGLLTANSSNGAIWNGTFMGNALSDIQFDGNSNNNVGCGNTYGVLVDNGAGNNLTAACPVPPTTTTTTTTTTVPPTTTTTFTTGYVPLITGSALPGLIISAGIILSLIGYLFATEGLNPESIAKAIIFAIIVVALLSALAPMWFG